jgi:class 3 adenylate cyclase/tetratricopeptide (TPR) repeat protein
MRCSACSTENPPQAKFCLECGAPLARRCSACGTLLPDVAKFCLECGQPISAAGAAPTPSIAPQAYTPRHLAEKILASRAGLEGERKQVTILFADVVGSTELIRDLDTEEAQRLLDGAVERMMAAVHRYEGTVSRAMGDGLMAIFGAPIAHEDHALRACYAALAMQDAVRRYADALRREHGREVEIRVGLNSGEVIVRLISDDLHMDYTAMGQTVHLAARMEQRARASTTRLTARTLALVEGYVQARALGPVPVKGLDSPLDAYELVGAGAARTRLQAASARGLTRFVGRQAELDALYAALEGARAGRGQVAALVGEAGVGKSRLVWELTHSHRVQSWTVLESGSVSYGKATTYLPVIDLLKSYCRVESRDDERTIREKVTGKLLTLDRALEPLLPPLLSLLDVTVDDPAWEALDPAQRRRRTLDAVRRLLLRESQEQPLLLVYEDLHWIDAETQALLDALVDSLPTATVLLLVNYRPEYTHGWGSKSYYTQLRIDPLTAASADELLAGLIGDDPSTDPLKALLAERTEGNPFFLEESVRSLIETGALVGERGAYRLPAPLTDVRVPPTVQAILAARIDRLPPTEKRLLQTAAVIGKDVPDSLLRAIADLDDDALQRGLSALRAAEFLYDASLFPEPEYTFKHALTHEVAYGSLLGERRKSLHARVVGVIETIYADRLDEQTELLAHHALRAETWEPAVTYCRLAGQRAAERSAYGEAATWFEQALGGLPHLPERRETHELAIDVRLGLVQVLVPLAANRRSLELLAEADTLAKAIDDPRRRCVISNFMINPFAELGDYDSAIAAGERALGMEAAADDTPLRSVIAYNLAHSYLQRGDLRRSADTLKAYVEAVPRPRELARLGLIAQSMFRCHYQLARVLGQLGEFEDAIAHGWEAVRGCEGSDDPFGLATGCNILGRVYLDRGDDGRALPLLERGVEVSRTNSLPNALAWALAILGAAHTLAGRATDAVPLQEEALEVARSHGILSGYAYWTTWLGEAYLAVGRIADARRMATTALDAALERQERVSQVVALRALGEIASDGQLSDANESEAKYREALALAEVMEMRPLQAHCHLGLGKLYARAGRRDEARAELRAAVEMLGEMGMTFWLPEAEAELTATTESQSTEPVG